MDVKEEGKKDPEPTPQCCQPYCPFKQQLFYKVVYEYKAFLEV